MRRIRGFLLTVCAVMGGADAWVVCGMRGRTPTPQVAGCEVEINSISHIQL